MAPLMASHRIWAPTFTTLNTNAQTATSTKTKEKWCWLDKKKNTPYIRRKQAISLLSLCEEY
jgi:hypothetical protein